MDKLLRNLDRNRIKVYCGQILVHTNDYFENLGLLRDLFHELRALNLKVDAEESQFLKRELVYLVKALFYLLFILISKRRLLNDVLRF